MLALLSIGMVSTLTRGYLNSAGNTVKYLLPIFNICQFHLVIDLIKIDPGRRSGAEWWTWMLSADDRVWNNKISPGIIQITPLKTFHISWLSSLSCGRVGLKLTWNWYFSPSPQHQSQSPPASLIWHQSSQHSLYGNSPPGTLLWRV